MTDGVDAADRGADGGGRGEDAPDLSEDAKDSLGGGTGVGRDGEAGEGSGSRGQAGEDSDSGDRGDESSAAHGESTSAAHGYDEAGIDVPANDPADSHEPTPAERAASEERMAAEAQSAKQAYEHQQENLKADAQAQALGSAMGLGFDTPRELTEAEQTAIDRGQLEGLKDAATGALSDYVDGALSLGETALQSGVAAAELASETLVEVEIDIPFTDKTVTVDLPTIPPVGPGIALNTAAMVGKALPDSWSQTQIEDLQAKGDALRETITNIDEIPQATKAYFDAKLAERDALRDAYFDGHADIDVLEEAARIDAQTKAEMAVLAAETAGIVIGGAGAVAKLSKAVGKLDIPGGVVAAMGRATEISRGVARDVREFIADQSGSVGVPEKRSFDRALLDQLREGRKFNVDNWHRYEYNEITLENGKRVDSINLNDSNPEIVSRKNTQLSEIEISTAEAYLRELKAKYPPTERIPPTPKNRQLEIDGLQLAGPQILEVPVQKAPVPQAVLDAAADRGITIRDVDGTEYN